MKGPGRFKFWLQLTCCGAGGHTRQFRDITFNGSLNECSLKVHNAVTYRRNCVGGDLAGLEGHHATTNANTSALQQQKLAL